ncbi:MAG: hypothetical protein ACLFPL_03975 [Candidatus Nanoarchaeia archaeon]
MTSSFKSSKQQRLDEIKQQFYKDIKQYKEEFKPTNELTSHSTIPIITSKHYPQISTMQITNPDISASQYHQNEFVKQDYSAILKSKARSIAGVSSKPTHKTNTRSNLHETIRDIYASKTPQLSRHIFENDVKINNIVSTQTTGLLGSSNSLQSIEVDDNISISTHIEKYNNGEVRAKEAILNLYYKGFNDNQIRSLLSLGSFGKENNKILVPTKWAISACDSIIEQDLYSKIINYNISNSYELYYYEDKGNAFLICLFPNQFCAEVIETWFSSSTKKLVIERDFVNFSNKLQTKEPECAGGYWATKLAILEHLYKHKKQSAFLSIRLINNYEIPLGVIFVRESVREAMKAKPILQTQSQEEYMSYIQTHFQNHFAHVQHSRVLQEISQVKSLREFI